MRVAFALMLVACNEAGQAPADASISADTISAEVIADVATDSAVDSAPDITSNADVPAACTAYVCEDFEHGLDAATWTTVSPSCAGSGVLAVTSAEAEAEAHSGSHALAVTGGGGYCDHVFLQTPITFDGPVFARFWVRFASALGDNHTTFMTMRDANNGKDLRMGGQAKILMWNRESDDATLPSLSPTGIAASVVPDVATWTCIELRVDGAAGTIDTWVDSLPIAGLTVDATPTADIDQQWKNSPWQPDLTTFALGWESYAGQTMDLMFDDVVVDDAPIGCD